jgi:cytochrome P450
LEDAEKFSRAYPVANSPRRVAEDLEFHGVKMKKGEGVVLAASLAGRALRCLSMAAGSSFAARMCVTWPSPPDRTCVGAPLTRRELKISLEEWLTRAPPFEITFGDEAITRGRGVFEVQRLPLSWRR